MLMAGEALASRLARALQELRPQLTNLYGNLRGL